MNHRIAIAALMVLGLAPLAAHAQSSYSIAEIPTFGGRESAAFQINDSGQVTGYALNTAGLANAFLWSNTSFLNLGTMAGGNSQGYAINKNGEVAGSANSSSGLRAVCKSTPAGAWENMGVLSGGRTSVAQGINSTSCAVGYSLTIYGVRAFYCTNGQMLDLGTLGGRSAYAYDVNDANEVTGYAQDAGNIFRAFLWSNGKMRSLGSLGGMSQGFGINNLSQVVGVSWLAGNTAKHAVLWANGRQTDLGTLGGANSTAYEINDSGVIVGDADLSSGLSVAFVYSGGKMTDLNSRIPAGSGWTLTSARSVNSNGQIVGTGYLRGQKRGFVLTPLQ